MGARARPRFGVALGGANTRVRYTLKLYANGGNIEVGSCLHGNTDEKQEIWGPIKKYSIKPPLAV